MQESEKLREMGQALIAMADSMDSQKDSEEGIDHENDESNNEEETEHMPSDSENEMETESPDESNDDNEMKKNKKAALIMILSKKLGKK